MKRLISIVSCSLLVSLASVGCQGNGKKEEPAAAKAAEGEPAAPAAVPAAPAADPAAAAAAQAGLAGAPAAPVAPVEPNAEEKALAEGAVKMLEEMASAAEANHSDCGKSAKALQSIVDKNKGLIEAGRKMDSDPGKKAWFEQNYQDRMMASMKKMAPLMETCRNSPELLKVFNSMQ